MTRKAVSSGKSVADIKQFQLSLERMDFVLPQVLDFVEHRKWMNIRPEYQRRLVWDLKKRSLLIESLLLNIPVPPVFLFEHEWGRYEVMDGQQRINSVLEYMSGGFSLKHLERLQELNGLEFKELPKAVQRVFDRRRLSATVLLAESATTQEEMDDLRRLVFERLNTGGLPLNQQELRNCLYSGPFNDLLVELAALPTFCKLWGIPQHKPTAQLTNEEIQKLAAIPRFRRMEDCEIVLRFFAFSIPPAQLKGAVTKMLDNCMKGRREVSEPELDIMRSEFKTVLSTCLGIFGYDGFKVPTEKGELRQSEVYFDALMIAVSRLLQTHTKASFVKAKVKIKKRLDKALKNPDYYELIVGRANTAATLRERFDLTECLIAECL